MCSDRANLCNLGAATVLIFFFKRFSSMFLS